MYKTSIMKKFTIISDFSINLSFLKKKYSFLVSKNLFNKPVIVKINFGGKLDSKINFLNQNLMKKENKSIFVFFNGRYLEIKNSVFDYKIQILIDKNISKLKLIEIIDDLIFIKLIQSKFLPIHSSGFYLKQKGYLIASYGGVGKTRIILEANKFSNKCKIFDEWCLVKNKTLFPFSNEILLMNYDITSNKKNFSSIDYYRAKISQFIPFQKLKELFRILRIILPYKYQYFKNINFFTFKNFFFVKQKNLFSIKFQSIKKNAFANQILENFKHEKKRLLKLVSINNSISEFRNKKNLIKIYNLGLIKILNNCKYRNILIGKNKKNFNKILNEILVNG